MAKYNFDQSNIESMDIEQLKVNCLKSIEDGNLSLASSIFKEYIELIVFNLLTVDHFFGTFIIHMQREIRYDFAAPAGVSIRKGVVNLALNPILLLRYTHKQVKAILKHEIYHLLHFHLLRHKENSNRYDSYIENIAMDMSINQFISDIPDDCITFDNFCKMYKLNPYDVTRKAEYEYYLDLIHNSDRYKEESEKYNQMMKDLQDILDQLGQGMSGGGQQQNDKENGMGGKSIQEMLDEILDKKYPVDHSMWEDSDSSDVGNMKEIVKGMVNEALKHCGNIPGELQELINKINEPVIIKWQDELKMFVGSVRCPFKRTPLRRPRRAPERYDLKGRLSDRKVRITVAIDTSGSMSEKELSFVFNEIFEILRMTKFELTIIECDMEIGRVYKAKSINEVDTKVTGRGGTLVTPVFKYIKEELSKKSSDKPDLIIYFTDGFAESHIDDCYRPPLSTKLMWVLTGKKSNLSVNNPWTNKIRELNIGNNY